MGPRHSLGILTTKLPSDHGLPSSTPELATLRGAWLLWTKAVLLAKLWPWVRVGGIRSLVSRMTRLRWLLCVCL